MLVQIKFQQYLITTHNIFSQNNEIVLLKTPKFLVDLTEKYISANEETIDNNINQGKNYYS